MLAILLATCAHSPPAPTAIGDRLETLGPLIAHRASAAVCAPRTPRARLPGRPRPAPCASLDCWMASDCSADEDCDQRPNGHCVHWMLKGYQGDRCEYDDCYRDEDCAGRGVCACGDTQNRCLGDSDCRVDADCGSGRWCSPSSNCGFDIVAYHCRARADLCVDAGDCPATPRHVCAFDDATRRWSCASCDRR